MVILKGLLAGERRKGTQKTSSPSKVLRERKGLKLGEPFFVWNLFWGHVSESGAALVEARAAFAEVDSFTCGLVSFLTSLQCW